MQFNMVEGLWLPCRKLARMKSSGVMWHLDFRSSLGIRLSGSSMIVSVVSAFSMHASFSVGAFYSVVKLCAVVLRKYVVARLRMDIYCWFGGAPEPF